MSSNRQSPVQTALIWHFPKKSAQFRFFLPEIRPPQTFLWISPYPQKNAFLRITLAQEIEGEEEKKEERKDQLRRKDIKRLRKKVKEKKKIDHQENQMILDPEQVLALKKLTNKDEKSKKQELGASNLHASEDLKISLDKMDVDERIKKIILHFSDIFGPLPPPGSVKKLVTMDLELREEFLKDRDPCRPYPA